MPEFYPETLFNVVLVEPEIPNNTGNIGRTCVGLWSKLHLVGPLGFTIDDKQLKRAGLDYWGHLDVQYHQSRQHWMKSVPDEARVHLIETSGDKSIYDIEFKPGDHIVFGRETTGISKDVLEKYSGCVYRIPFPGQLRSFNLSNCVAMVLGEAYRQISAGRQNSPARKNQ